MTIEFLQSKIERLEKRHEQELLAYETLVDKNLSLQSENTKMRETLLSVLQVSCDGDECSTIVEYQELLNKISDISIKAVKEAK